MLGSVLGTEGSTLGTDGSMLGSVLGTEGSTLGTDGSMLGISLGTIEGNISSDESNISSLLSTLNEKSISKSHEDRVNTHININNIILNRFFIYTTQFIISKKEKRKKAFKAFKY